MRHLILLFAVMLIVAPPFPRDESSRDVGRNLCELAKAASPDTMGALIVATGNPVWSADAYCTTFCGMDQVFCQNTCVDCLQGFDPTSEMVE